MGQGLIRADGPIHENALVNRGQKRAAHRDIVEGRMEEIKAQHTKITRTIDAVHDNVAMPAQKRQQIRMRLFPPIGFIVLQCGRCSGRIRHDAPFDPIKMHGLATRHEVRGFLARLIGFKTVIDSDVARTEQILPEAEGAAAGEIADLLESIGFRDAFGHDGANAGRWLTERPSQARPRLLQANFKAIIVQRTHFIQQHAKPLAKHISL